VDLIHDVYGNSIAWLQPGAPAERLRITCRFTVDHLGNQAFGLPAAHESQWMPPSYTQAERLALTPFLLASYPDPGHAVRAWAQGFAQAPGGPRAVIAAMTQAIRESLSYTVREAEGVQTPQQTLALGSGSCRDFATLMIDALRQLGIAARFVSGYLYSPGKDAAGTGPAAGHQGGGATHAWAQVYLPDCGWFPVDPTNNLIGGSDLIRVAWARDASEVAPLSGAWYGEPADYAGMHVEVLVKTRIA
jgi:transglutaminase-like putative cysteine protease